MFKEIGKTLEERNERIQQDFMHNMLTSGYTFEIDTEKTIERPTRIYARTV